MKKFLFLILAILNFQLLWSQNILKSCKSDDTSKTDYCFCRVTKDYSTNLFCYPDSFILFKSGKLIPLTNDTFVLHPFGSLVDLNGNHTNYELNGVIPLAGKHPRAYHSKNKKLFAFHEQDGTILTVFKYDENISTRLYQNQLNSGHVIAWNFNDKAHIFHNGTIGEWSLPSSNVVETNISLELANIVDILFLENGNSLILVGKSDFSSYGRLLEYDFNSKSLTTLFNFEGGDMIEEPFSMSLSVSKREILLACQKGGALETNGSIWILNLENTTKSKLFVNSNTDVSFVSNIISDGYVATINVFDKSDRSIKLLNMNISNKDTFWLNIELGDWIYSLNDMYTGINKMTVNPNNVLNLWPNPAKSIIKTNLIDYYYEIFDLTGKPILSGISQNNSINVTGLSMGSYILRIESEENIYFERILKID